MPYPKQHHNLIWKGVFPFLSKFHFSSNAGTGPLPCQQAASPPLILQLSRQIRTETPIMVNIFSFAGALIQVSQAAAHANDSMKRIDQFKKLLEVQESIGGGIDLVSPTREVLKEGRMVKISARTGDHQERYLFLLSDLLLLCSPRKSMMAGPQFGLRARFEVDNMQVSQISKTSKQRFLSRDFLSGAGGR